MFWVYTLLCRDNSLYTGFTDDIKRRVYAHYHRLKSAAKYTKSHKVCGIAGLWLCDCETAARKLEYRIKRLEKAKKLALLQNPEKIPEFFPELAEYSITPDTEIKFEDCI
ncbi:MAG: GIY-YIG nuclease family protein [Oscillospiraceae bacterium]|nr:GIY-YIG nuclease family protein [Oscillospiraceae bacterium]